MQIIVLDKTLSRNYNIIMRKLKFEWDPKKAETNIKKHNITFEEARTVFEDESAILFDDPDHSSEEDRFILLGFSSAANMLVVCHCYKDDSDVIRIISAREATKSESKQYHEINKGW